jgi:xanthine dehydrogenase accessory factor
MPNYTFQLNGERVTVEVEKGVRLLWVLRDVLGVTGPKYGCGINVCKACTSHLNGKAFNPCAVPVDKLDADDEVTTIEGLADTVPGDDLHPMQEAWLQHDVAQCGYCQPGQIMTAGRPREPGARGGPRDHRRRSRQHPQRVPVRHLLAHPRGGAHGREADGLIVGVADDTLHRAARWATDGPVALATVVGTTGSAPRQPGALMALSPTGDVVGSVSSGCVEAAVVDLAEATLASGEPTLRSYGYSADDLFEVGLTCGGRIEVFVQRVDDAEQLTTLARDVGAGAAVALVTVLEHPDPARVGSRLLVRPDTDGLPGADLDARLVDTLVGRARALLDTGASGEVRCGLDGTLLGASVRAFVQVWAPPPRLVVFGAVDFAGALAGVGRFLGYDVTVCDARPVFTTRERFPDAHRVVVDWPHRYLAQEQAAGRIDGRTVLCVLTHDARFDVPVLQEALRLPAVGYVGAMGSRRTHHERVERLRAAGVRESELERLHSPIGLDLGARTPEETALSIAAEFVAARRGGTGRSLGDVEGPIHRAAGAVPSAGPASLAVPSGRGVVTVEP